jgi:hypothetical protein
VIFGSAHEVAFEVLAIVGEVCRSAEAEVVGGRIFGIGDAADGLVDRPKAFHS